MTTPARPYEAYTAKAADIRVYPAEEPYDRSDMYVVEVLGVTLYVRRAPAEDRDGRLKIFIEAAGVFDVSVNDDEHSYGEAS